MIEYGAGVSSVHSSSAYARGCRSLRVEGWVFVAFVRDFVDVDILENLKTATDKDGVEEGDAGVVKLDSCRATPRIGEMRSAGTLGHYDRGHGGGGARGSGQGWWSAGPVGVA